MSTTTTNEAAERLEQLAAKIEAGLEGLRVHYGQRVTDHELAQFLTGYLATDLTEALAAERRAAGQCDGYAGDPGASAPRCESYRGHPGPHFIRHDATNERRATVERIRERLVESYQDWPAVGVLAILDEEAAL